MWKKPLCVSAEISPTLLLRAVSDSSSLRRFRYSPPFSSCRSFATIGAQRNAFPFLKCSIFGAIESNFGSMLVKSCNSFCSQPKIAVHFRCWNCGAGAESAAALMFCQVCRSVQPVDESIDYFHIFALKREYKIELEELEKVYKEWQKKLHPDLVHSKSQREKDYAAEQSARVIGAYYTLADPLSRAIYIAKLEGKPVDEEERITDPELLAEVMEIRESIDDANDTQSLNAIHAQLQEKFLDWSNSFQMAINARNHEDALSSIRRMIYYRRAIEEVVKKL